MNSTRFENITRKAPPPANLAIRYTQWAGKLFLLVFLLTIFLGQCI